MPITNAIGDLLLANITIVNNPTKIAGIFIDLNNLLENVLAGKVIIEFFGLSILHYSQRTGIAEGKDLAFLKLRVDLPLQVILQLEICTSLAFGNTMLYASINRLD